MNYDWKRYWHKFGNSPHISNGFLFVSEYLKDVFSLDDVLDTSCLILLGEPGMGKSKEIERIYLLSKFLLVFFPKLKDLTIQQFGKQYEEIIFLLVTSLFPQQSIMQECLYPTRLRLNYPNTDKDLYCLLSIELSFLIEKSL